MSLAEVSESTAVGGIVMATTTDVYTFRDYLNAVDEHRKAHLLDGMIVMESPASLRHEQIVSFLNFLLVGFVSEKELGIVLGSHAAFRLKGHNAVQPDVAFISNERLHLATTHYFNGPPDLAVEIVSKGTRKLDYERKKNAYERAETPELWIIDYLERRADFFTLSKGTFQPLPLERGRLASSRVLPGFQVDVRWFFSDPLPNPSTILKKLLD